MPPAFLVWEEAVIWGQGVVSSLQPACLFPAQAGKIELPPFLHFSGLRGHHKELVEAPDRWATPPRPLT